LNAAKKYELVHKLKCFSQNAKKSPPCDAVAGEGNIVTGQCAKHGITTLHFYYDHESAKRMPENGR
jgi:hypothetical protein